MSPRKEGSRAIRHVPVELAVGVGLDGPLHLRGQVNGESRADSVSLGESPSVHYSMATRWLLGCYSMVAGLLLMGHSCAVEPHCNF